jgi:PIN domain nuclease of toxin-antitoxin system
MILIPDTHVVIWTVLEPKKLSRRAKAILADLNNKVLLSSVVTWEIAIKIAMQKLDLKVTLQELTQEFLSKMMAVALPIRFEHTYELRNLPHLHSDPFDRLLVTQALREEATIVTNDKAIKRYQVKTFW